METARTALEQAYLDYRTELETAEKKSRPTDGLFGIGRTIGDDACHEHFDARVRQAAEAAAEGKPSGDEAREAVRTLLLWEGDAPWPLSAQWMLRAAERSVVAVDHTKFGRVALAKICDVQDISLVLTDNQIDPDMLSRLHKLNVNIETV